MTNLPRSVYVHVPFCRHRCGYCNFSLVAGRDYLVDRFLAAIDAEIQTLPERFEIDTLFLGGGTPSHLSPPQLERLFQILNSRFELADDAEVTAECNPSDASPEKINALADQGVNRISMGVQSFDAGKLKHLERDHNASIVRRAVDLVRNRIDNISLDLIFATSGETLATWERDLDAAIAIAPDHLSTYELTWEEGTDFFRRVRNGDLHPSSEDACATMYEMAMDRLPGAGLRQYEISSFAAEGKRCRHNLQYWNGSGYFAFGPGAASFVDGERRTNHHSTMQYLKLMESNGTAVVSRERLAGRDAAIESLVIMLRTVDGIDETDFRRRHDVDAITLMGDVGETLLREELMQRVGSRIRLTRRGRMVCDHIAVQIYRQ